MKHSLLQYWITCLLVLQAVSPNYGYSRDEIDWMLAFSLLSEVLSEKEPESIELANTNFENVEDAYQVQVSEKRILLEIRRENLQKKLEKHVQESSSIRKFCTNLAQESSSTALTLGINVFANFLKQQFVRYFNLDGSAGSVACDLIMTQMAGSTINQAVGNMRNGFQELGGNSSKMKVASIRDVHQELVQESEQELLLLPEDIRNQVKRVDDAIFRELNTSESRVDFLSILIERRELILRSIPTLPRNVAHYDKQGDPQSRVKTDQRVKTLIEEYPPEKRDVIATLVQRIRDSSIFKHSDRAQGYLYGPPGTGKTRFVQKLAKALDLPLCEISFKDSKEEEILGKNFDTLLNLTEKEILITGKLGRCFIESGVTNPIIFFDEAGETLSENGLRANSALLSFLKDILDPDRKEILFRGMGINIDFSRATILFAGNEQMENTALRSRLPSIFFDKLGHDEKLAAANEALTNALFELGIVFQTRDVEAIRIEFEKFKEFLIESDMAINPGGRIIKAVVLDTLNFIRIRVLNQEPIVEAQVKKMIQISLEQRSPLVVKLAQ